MEKICKVISFSKKRCTNFSNWEKEWKVALKKREREGEREREREREKRGGEREREREGDKEKTKVDCGRKMSMCVSACQRQRE